jgi:hypoxanthine phosphoribosyltransferase
MLTHDPTIEAVLFTAEEIAAAIESLAAAVARDYRDEPVVLVGVLKGALFVTADLARALARRPDGPSEIHLDFIAVSSYGNANRSSGEVRLLKDTAQSLEDRNVVIVEDIIDNGLTLDYLQHLLGGRRPRSLRTCVLLDKPYRRSIEVAVDYRGMLCPDEFIVGYGLDYQERYRTLPYLAKLRADAFPTDPESKPATFLENPVSNELETEVNLHSSRSV